MSKTAYNLISMKAKDITEMMVDDLLEELVIILNNNEQVERDKEKQAKEKGYIQDLLDNLIDYEGTQNQMMNDFKQQQRKKENLREVQVEGRLYRQAMD